MHFNSVTIVGNATRDPETRHTTNGTQVTKFGIATNEKFGATEHVLFINVEAWGKLAEIVEKYVKKGNEVLVQGALRMNKYTTKDGQERTEFFISASTIKLGRSKDRADGESSSPPRESRREPSAAPASPDPATEDDLPF